MDWFRVPLPVDRRSGPGVATVVELTAGYGDDPVLAVRLGHPLADRGFEFLMRDILRAVLAPRNHADWLALLAEPPGPGELAARLAPYRETFRLDHPVHPAMQVRPAPDRLAAAAAGKPGKKRKPAEEDEDGEEEEAGAQPIAALLPDLPTGEAVKQDADFFVRRGGVTAIGAGAILPVLYAHMVLFPPGGGGYLGLPHGADSLKFQLVGRTLWETIWLNVLTRGAEGGGDAPWPARPDDPAVFPWLDPDLPNLPLGRKEEGAAKPLIRGRLHPAHIPMPRRYLLSPAVPGRCDLTGLEGPVFTGYSRWPKGLQYSPQGWWTPCTAPIQNPAKPADPPQFVKARGPLRFDDWLGAALFQDDPPDRKGKRRLVPPVLRQFREATVDNVAAEAILAAPGRATAAVGDGAVRVRAVAQFFYNKPVGGMSQRELPVWRLDREGQSWLATTATRVAEQVGHMAGTLRQCAKSAATAGRLDGHSAIADTLRDALLAAMDGAVLDLPGTLAGIARRHAGDMPARQAAREAARLALLTETRRTALRLFDEAFPIDGITKAAVRLAEERGKLLAFLSHTITSPPAED